MRRRVIDGTFVLEGPGDVEVTERQTGALRELTDEERFELSFVTAHQFHLPDGLAQRVWLRFDAREGRTLVRQDQGVQAVVTLLGNQVTPLKAAS